MSDNHPKSYWWILYTVLPLTAGLFVLEVNTTMSPLWHQMAEIGILVFAFAFVQLWLSTNTLALIRGKDEPRREPMVARPDRKRLYVIRGGAAEEDKAPAA